MNLNSRPTEQRRVAVVGGGISGLAAAHRLAELCPQVEITIFEAGDRFGGVLQSIHRDGFLIERSADMFITKDPWALELCRRLGIADQLIGTHPGHRQAFVVHRGRLVPVPGGFTLMAPARMWPMLTTPLLSPWGKLRAACEYFIPPRRDAADESLASFVTRRLGRETYAGIVQPLIGGIYTADPQKLSMAATMKQFVDMERRDGGLLRAMRKQQRAVRAGASGSTSGGREASGARYSLFVTPRDGMSSLVAALVAHLSHCHLHLNAAVERVIATADGRWRIATRDPADDVVFDAVILATPAAHTARILTDLDPELSAELTRITSASTAVVIVGYRREQLQHPLNGTGFVVPLRERRRILAGSFSSVKFAGRAPDGQVLLRIFIGGACQPELADLSDEDLRRLVGEELGELLGASGEPLLFDVVRWRATMPQYHVGHLDLVDQIERHAARWPGLALAGNAYRGVGIPFCVRSGEEAAQRLAPRLSAASV